MIFKWNSVAQLHQKQQSSLLPRGEAYVANASDALTTGSSHYRCLTFFCFNIRLLVQLFAHFVYKMTQNSPRGGGCTSSSTHTLPVPNQPSNVGGVIYNMYKFISLSLNLCFLSSVYLLINIEIRICVKKLASLSVTVMWF